MNEYEMHLGAMDRAWDEYVTPDGEWRPKVADDELLAEATRLANAATPGEWAIETDTDFEWGEAAAIPKVCGPIVTGEDGIIYPLAPADAQFIAWCRTGVPSLVARVAGLVAERQELQAEIEEQSGLLDQVNAHYDGALKRVADVLNGEPAPWLRMHDRALAAEAERDRLKADLAATQSMLNEFDDDIGVVQAERDEAKKLVIEMLRTFTERGHPGRPCTRSGWQHDELVAQWHLRAAVLSDDGSTE